MSDHDYEAIFDEMNFEVVDHGALELPSSTPATFNYEAEPAFSMERVKEELDERAFMVVDPMTEEKEDEFYMSVKILTDHMNEVRAKATAKSFNLFPSSDRLDTYELSRIIHSFESALETELTLEPTGNTHN